ncbi:Panacea domain-containing protein [Xenorhabdus bovienii]|uniref:Panacea domain-containing protein n=1 Tax=Xenorhabdus bovienii TaxID=40576 RepID=UPI00237CC161|nr:Panacea domain-containing protein [Xenorhabdus bovienii]MDE1482354.1 SocA family protein [Xenorhabdus bovienii]MDE9441702.1 SocA family protein [Xenorhabdus bovienii]MDE9461328.1 SocA family protein [Xenorhabdus bovienii]MDE9469633.1 SocA family protein [Xenorhabdus bovienii]
MNRLQQIIAFLCSEYPMKQELSKARLTKMVYLADWFSSLVNDVQLTNIEWVFNHYGPYVDDVISDISFSPNFKVEQEKNIYGSPKYIVFYIGNKSDINLDSQTKDILHLVIDKTRSMYFNEFIDYVYSTYPIKQKTRYSKLDLPYLAKEYKNNIQRKQ